MPYIEKKCRDCGQAQRRWQNVVRCNKCGGPLEVVKPKLHTNPLKLSHWLDLTSYDDAIIEALEQRDAALAEIERLNKMVDEAGVKFIAAHDLLDKAGVYRGDGTHPQLVERIKMLIAERDDYVQGKAVDTAGDVEGDS